MVFAENAKFRKRVIEDMLSENIYRPDGNEPDEYAMWRGDTLLLLVKRVSDDLAAFMKLIRGSTAERQIDAIYKIHKMIPDKKNLEPLLESSPREYNGCKSIVIRRGKYSLKEYLDDMQNRKVVMDEKEIIDVILQSSLGLKKLHDRGIIHRDVKESNIMRYEQWWGLGDYGFSSIGSSREYLDISTATVRQTEEYLPFEILRDMTQGVNYYRFNCSTDIFSLGIVLHKSLHDKNLSPLQLSRMKIGKDSKETVYTPEQVLTGIDSLKVSDKAKYFMKRMLAEAPPEGIYGRERLKYRYTSVDELLDDAKNWPDIKRDGGVNVRYAEFIKDKDEFTKLLQTEGKKLDVSGMIEHKSIDRIVTAYERLLHKFNTSGVKQSTSMQDQYLNEATEQYNRLRAAEEAKLKYYALNMTKSLKDMLIVDEKMFLWGPPFTDENEFRKKTDGKARYTYDETWNKNTHYHKTYK